MGETLSWEETIKLIRTQPEYQTLVDNSYFNADLPLNVERFKQSAEFIETLKLLKQYQPLGKTILDIGSGNGVSAIALALDGYNVTTIEPDPSETI
ncbi:MAG TPA: SAM-dependent methyltransferase, partial [Bacteroidia bacterium]|nr:SAM-dependent methyltransferase [Bacteroidia bacterium]